MNPPGIHSLQGNIHRNTGKMLSYPATIKVQGHMTTPDRRTLDILTQHARTL